MRRILTYKLTAIIYTRDRCQSALSFFLGPSPARSGPRFQIISGPRWSNFESVAL